MAMAMASKEEEEERRRRSKVESTESLCVLIYTLMFFITLGSIFGYMFIHLEKFSTDILSNLHSFSIYDNHDANSFSCHVLLSLQNQPHTDDQYYLNMPVAKASVHYKHEPIWTQLLTDPVGLPRFQQINIHINLTTILPDWVAADFRNAAAGQFSFGFELEGIASPANLGGDWGSSVHVWCDLKAAVSNYSNSAAAIQLTIPAHNSAPVHCYSPLHSSTPLP